MVQVQRRITIRHRDPLVASRLRPVAGAPLVSSRRNTPPGAYARDHCRWQISWLAGRRLRPPSQERRVPSGLMAGDSPLTVAGAAAALPVLTSAPRSLLIPCGNHQVKTLHGDLEPSTALSFVLAIYTAECEAARARAADLRVFRFRANLRAAWLIAPSLSITLYVDTRRSE